jgi:hypothetical protein
VHVTLFYSKPLCPPGEKEAGNGKTGRAILEVVVAVIVEMPATLATPAGGPVALEVLAGQTGIVVVRNFFPISLSLPYN